MKIAINTSSFSLRFIGVLCIVLAAVLVIFSFMTGLIFAVIGLLLVWQSYKYLIMHQRQSVTDQVIKTLDFLSLKYRRENDAIAVSDVRILIRSLGFVTLLSFKFNKINSTKGSYLANTLVKYQRYI